MRVPFANTNTLKIPADLVDQRVSLPADAALATCFIGVPRPPGRYAACLARLLCEAATSMLSLLPAGDCLCCLLGSKFVAFQVLYWVPAGGWPGGLLPALRHVACGLPCLVQACAHMLLHGGQGGACCLLCRVQVCFLSDIFPTAWHGTELGDVSEGDTVGIWGCGPGMPRPPAATAAHHHSVQGTCSPALRQPASLPACMPCTLNMR